MGVFRILGVMILALAVPAVVFAAGAHEGLNCVGCHAIHTAKGEIIFAVEPNKKPVSPKTKKSFSGVTALCLGCHETIENGGMGIAPVPASHSHPYGVGVNPKIANVPSELMRDGKFECIACHDPHPSNPNFKYLRVDTARGGKMGDFCAMCHASKAGSVPGNLKIFDSMDERRGAAPAAAPSASPAAAPAAPKKK